MSDRPGIIPLGPIPQDVLDELRAITLAASMYDWEWTHSGTETQEAALEYMTAMLAHSNRTDLNLVTFNDDGEIPYAVAITGNGKDSEANARYICAAQPVNVMRLLNEIERLRSLCPFCSRTIAECDEDDAGCGTTKAKEETWMDRPPLA